MPYKKELLTIAQTLLSTKIQQCRAELATIQQDANNETKSSMGDKYETGRAMAQNEKDKLKMSLSNLLEQEKTLAQIKFGGSAQIGFGSVILTDKNAFFLSVALGKIPLNGKDFYALSPASPLGKLAIGKSPGDSLTLGGLTQIILEVEN